MGDWKDIAVWALGAVCAGLGWWARVMWDAVQKLKDDLATLQLNIAQNYVRKDDLKERLNEALEPVRDALHEIKEWIKGQR